MFTPHDDKNPPRVAVVNRGFAPKIFGSITSAIGRLYKLQHGTRIQVVGIVEDGKYNSVTGRSRAGHVAILQSPSGSWLVVRSNRDQQQLMTAIKVYRANSA